MSTGIKFESRAFREEFRKRVARSTHTMAEVTNEVAFQVLRRWQKHIPKGNRAEIEAMGVTYRTVNKKGTRQLKRRQGAYNPTSAFKLISLKSMWLHGPNPRSFPSSGALDAAIARRLSRRMSSVGFVASGPVPAMRALIAKIRGHNLTGDEAKRFKGTKGGAKPAKNSFSPFAEFENATGMNVPHQEERSQNRVTNLLMDTLALSFNEVTAEMGEYSAKRLEDTLHGKI